MTCDEQLEAWLEGRSLHNEERGECCPDFSCCQPTLLADEATRRAFVRGDERVRNELLGMFLGKCIQLAFGEKAGSVHVIADSGMEGGEA